MTKTMEVGIERSGWIWRHFWRVESTVLFISLKMERRKRSRGNIQVSHSGNGTDVGAL